MIQLHRECAVCTGAVVNEVHKSENTVANCHGTYRYHFRAYFFNLFHHFCSSCAVRLACGQLQPKDILDSICVYAPFSSSRSPFSFQYSQNATITQIVLSLLSAEMVKVNITSGYMVCMVCCVLCVIIIIIMFLRKKKWLKSEHSGI